MCFLTTRVLSTPGTAQAVVFGLPDTTLGEAIHVAYKTCSNKTIDVIEIKRHAKTSLAAYSIPHHCHFYEKIPLHPNGKMGFTSLKRDVLKNGGGDTPGPDQGKSG